MFGRTNGMQEHADKSCMSSDDLHMDAPVQNRLWRQWKTT